MAVTASQVFDFLERQEASTVDRHEFALAAFGTLRRSLRKIVLKLRESDDREALETSEHLRAALSEWLTVPIAFDCSMLDAVTSQLGGAEAVQARWGFDIRTLYDTALYALEDLTSLENPMREELRVVIRDLLFQGRAFRIYCHRRARPHFESLLVLPGEMAILENAFLHSVREYRETEPFDVLIKVGPLRAHGWGSAPDALLTAPRFGTLVQIVWSGCSDEPDFGYDPASPPKDSAVTEGAIQLTTASTHRGPIKWTTCVTRLGEDPGAVPGYAAEEDELRVFKQLNGLREKRRATLIQIDGEHGIMYAPHSHVLSFDPGVPGPESIGHRIPGETLLSGMFVILSLVGDVDLGGIRAEHGHYGQMWKARLEREWRTDAAGLIKRLRAAGLNLVHLDAAIRHWCKPPSTVIHAPQQMRHFEILLRVLGVSEDGHNSLLQKRIPLCQLAWNEVRRSRGEAIQAGFQEQEIIEEQLLIVFRKLAPQIQEKALANASFRLAIPPGYDMKGDCLFFTARAIEGGFSAPESEFKLVRELNLIDQWRD